MYHIKTRIKIFKQLTKMQAAFYFAQQERREFLMIGLGAIGGIFIVIGTALGAIDDLTNKN